MSSTELKKFMGRNRLSIDSLSDACGSNIRTIQHWLEGDREIPVLFEAWAALYEKSNKRRK